MANTVQKLEQYLQSVQDRLKKLVILRGAAIIAGSVLVLSVLAAWLSLRSGFADSTLITLRIIFILALAAVAFVFLIRPLQQLRSDLGHQLEQRSRKVDGKGFDGRIRTWLDMKADNNPFRELLAEDTLQAGKAYPATTQVPEREMRIAGIGTAATVLVFLYLLLAAPGMFNYSMQNFLAGWASDSFLPPQSIAVTPGNQSIRRGANLQISSRVEGFNPDRATLHLRSGDDDWQEVPLIRAANGFEFTLFSMQENMSYYVSTTGLRSPQYSIEVVDLPRIESMSLTYNFPEWTSREPETSRNGDIRALPDTVIDLSVTTSGPLPGGGQLILNESPQAMSINGNEASTSFSVTGEGQYYLAALVGGNPVRLSDDFFIRLSEDGRPELDFVRPGQDWNATNIEEVTARIQARDDYGLERLVLRYAINGGEWHEVDLGADGSREINADYIFMLEDMRARSAPRTRNTAIGAFDIVLGPEQPLTTDADAAAAVPEEVPLRPGDLIAYYAEAADRNQSVQTDMYFIQIQHFNRRYSQSQMSGGGGGGGGQQDEISQRQRQIVVSTWNLIREQTADASNPRIQINSTLLAELQLTLAQQAQTLAERTRARQLTNADEDIERFVASLELAVQAMHPSSERLAEIALNEAIQPAQEALQHLLQAEAIFNDITVSQQQGGGGGGGGNRARQDLAEMYELEMDMSVNQYESGNRITQQSQQQELDDIMRQLDELARRQEQLANNMRNQQQLTEAQRYQQEMLRRQAEQLQQQLDRIEQQQQQQNQRGQQQASAQGGQAGGQQGQQDNPALEAEAQQQARSELQRRMDSAIRAMNEASEAMANNASGEELQRAAEEAQRQLQGARQEMSQQQMADMETAFNNMAEQAQAMLREQQRMETRLQEAMAQALADRESGENPRSRGMSLREEYELADDKRAIASELQSLQQQMLNATQRFDRDAPQAARELERANSRIVERELELALSDAALYIDNGYGLYIVGNEGNVTQAMRELSESLARAQGLVAGRSGEESELERARQQARDLRNQLAEARQQQQGQGQGQEAGSDPQGAAAEGQATEEPQAGAAAGGGFAGGGWGLRDRSQWRGLNEIPDRPLTLPENFSADVEALTRLTRDALQQMDLTAQDQDQLLDLIRELEFSRFNFDTNRAEGILAQEYNNMLGLIEQLERSLRTDRGRDGSANVRTAASDAIPEEYQDSVAEYFRRLSRDN